MLRKNLKSKRGARRDAGRFVIVASRYNARYVNAMLRAARACLEDAAAARVKVVRVPGAYEIPVAVARLLQPEDHGWSAVLCLGVILRGQTEHAQLIAEAVTHSLTRQQVEAVVPVVHEVLLLENAGQARARCLDPDHNRGGEAAQTALEMSKLMRSI